MKSVKTALLFGALFFAVTSPATLSGIENSGEFNVVIICPLSDCAPLKRELRLYATPAFNEKWESYQITERSYFDIQKQIKNYAAALSSRQYHLLAFSFNQALVARRSGTIENVVSLESLLALERQMNNWSNDRKSNLPQANLNVARSYFNGARFSFCLGALEKVNLASLNNQMRIEYGAIKSLCRQGLADH